MNFVSTELRQLNVDKVYFNTSERTLNNYESVKPILSILNVQYPTNAVIQNVQIDASRLKSGFVFDINCNYPEAVLQSKVSFNNITAFYSQKKTSYNWARIIYYQGPANVTASNLNFVDYFSSYDDYKSTIYITSSQACQPDDGAVQLLTFEGATLSLQNYMIEIPLFNAVNMALQFSIYRRKIVSISSFKFVNYTVSAGPMVYLTGYYTDELYYSDNYHYNFKPQSEIILIETFNIVNIINAYFEAGSELELAVFHLNSISNVMLDNVTFVNVNNTSGVENIYINLDNYKSTITLLTNINVTNWYINSGIFVSSISPLNKLSLLNSYFNEINVEANSNLIIVDNIKSIDFINLTIQHIYWDFSNDVLSKFLLISQLNIQDDQNSTLQNILFSSSTTSFLTINSIQNNPTNCYFFNMINITLDSLSLSQPKSLIQFNKISEHVNLTFSFDSCTFSNIHFEFNGILFLLGQRIYTPVMISNSRFKNITAATIHLRPQEISDLTINDMIVIFNWTFENINSVFDSFIVAYEHGEVTINKWTFISTVVYEKIATGPQKIITRCFIFIF